MHTVRLIFMIGNTKMATVRQKVMASQHRERRDGDRSSEMRPRTRTVDQKRQCQLSRAAQAHLFHEPAKPIMAYVIKRACKPNCTFRERWASLGTCGHALPNIALPLAVFSNSDARRAQQRLKTARFKVLQEYHTRPSVDGPSGKLGDWSYPAPT